MQISYTEDKNLNLKELEKRNSQKIFMIKLNREHLILEGQQSFV